MIYSAQKLLVVHKAVKQPKHGIKRKPQWRTLRTRRKCKHLKLYSASIASQGFMLRVLNTYIWHEDRTTTQVGRNCFGLYWGWRSIRSGDIWLESDDYLTKTALCLPRSMSNNDAAATTVPVSHPPTGIKLLTLLLPTFSGDSGTRTNALFMKIPIWVHASQGAFIILRS